MQQEDEPREALDPAAERVRRKLVRFMGINLAILFAAVMAVVLAFVYKSVSPAGQPEQAILLPGDGPTGTLHVPQGARIVSQALDGTRVSLHLQLAGGREEIHVYDLRNGQLAARYAISR
ncbi:fimbrial protein [Nitratireductor sp. ZSWI3]|uniref:fimbrial protein n=1 Tax=Nitratireductor sp. ZSWI3 TaxID=2966359 RepID=UPI0021501E9F|nr:fimbrial protein [Nitratireductor sp. ZSWI3]MCR4267100.1 fimbrial protein [Nitratireductor sp. ZSWI3]